MRGWSGRTRAASGLVDTCRGQGLLTAQLIATGRFGLLPQVVAEADGGAIAAWLDRSNDAATATILASRYAPP